MGILTDERAALEEYERLFAPGSSEGPKHLRHYGALGLRRGRALARRQIPCTWRQCTLLHFRCRRDAGIARRRQLNLQNDRGLIGTIERSARSGASP